MAFSMSKVKIGASKSAASRPVQYRQPAAKAAAKPMGKASAAAAKAPSKPVQYRQPARTPVQTSLRSVNQPLSKQQVANLRALGQKKGVKPVQKPASLWNAAKAYVEQAQRAFLAGANQRNQAASGTVQNAIQQFYNNNAWARNAATQWLQGANARNAQAPTWIQDIMNRGVAGLQQRIPQAPKVQPKALPQGFPAPTPTVLPDTYYGQANRAWDVYNYGQYGTTPTLLPDTWEFQNQRNAELMMGPEMPPATGGAPTGNGGGGGGDWWNPYGGGGGGGNGGGGGYPGAGGVPAADLSKWLYGLITWRGM